MNGGVGNAHRLQRRAGVWARGEKDELDKYPTSCENLQGYTEWMRAVEKGRTWYPGRGTLRYAPAARGRAGHPWSPESLWGASWSAPTWGWGCLPGSAQALADRLRLLLVFRGCPPEDHPAWDFADGDRHMELPRDAQEVVLHPRRPDLRPYVDAGGLRGKGLNFLPQRVVKQRLHARPPAHAPGVLQGNVLKRHTPPFFSHGFSSVHGKSIRQ